MTEIILIVLAVIGGVFTLSVLTALLLAAWMAACK